MSRPPLPVTVLSGFLGVGKTSLLIPINYLQWRHCIEVDRGIALKPDFIAARIAALTQNADEPRRFARLYGDAHLQRVIGWFQRAQAEAPSG